MKNKQIFFKTVLNIFKTTSVSFVLVVLFLGFTAPVLAQGLATGIEYGAFTGLGTQDIRVSIMKVVRVFLGFVGIIALLLVLWGGYTWMSSAGRPDRIEQAKAILRNAAIGLMIILLAFSIVSFIINSLQDIFSSGGGGGGGPPPGGCVNCGYLGSGIIESVFPEPFSKDNPRNTNIMVTFKVAMDASTIINGSPVSCSTANPCTGTMVEGSISIFPFNNPGATLDPARVNVRSINGETFVFNPQDYLGNADNKVWYSVKLTDEVKKDNGETAFPGTRNYFTWRFEIGTFLDLDPVEARNVFPPPDDSSDFYNTSVAVQASGSIDVDVQPNFAQNSSVTQPNPVGGTPADSADLFGVYNCTVDTLISITVDPGQSKVTINPSVPIQGLPISVDINAGGGVGLGCGLSMTLHNLTPGNQWNFIVEAQRSADTLRVGNTTYTFVANGAVTVGNEINVGVTAAATAETANNIDAALENNFQVSDISVSGSTVSIKAALAGSAGNFINLIGSGSWSDISSMSGGENQVLLPSTVDAPDQPRNATIVINFNEAIDPTLATSTNILVQYFNGSAWQNVTGNYFVSNQFKTVEFLPDSICVDADGDPIANSCGDVIFCLPVIDPSPTDPYVATEYRVQINAGTLQTCEINSDCSDPNFNSCSAALICEGTFGASTAFYPEVSPTPKGITDAANNTFNGNKNTYFFNSQNFGDAEGPQSQSGQDPYSLNLPNSNLGDDMIWTFFINENIKLTPPVIELIKPNINFSGASLVDPIEATFEELLMSSSLKSGTGYQDGLCGGCTSDSQCRVADGEVCDPNTKKCVNTEGEQLFCAQDSECSTGLTCINKKYVTLLQFSTRLVGWWITKDGLDTVLPQDGYPDQDKANINHTTFPIMTNYGAEFGSGIQDVYQNCYIPSKGPGLEGSCEVTEEKPFCCSGVAMNQPTWEDSVCFTGF